jgi:hypothetical protein
MVTTPDATKKDNPAGCDQAQQAIQEKELDGLPDAFLLEQAVGRVSQGS